MRARASTSTRGSSLSLSLFLSFSLSLSTTHTHTHTHTLSLSLSRSLVLSYLRTPMHTLLPRAPSNRRHVLGKAMAMLSKCSTRILRLLVGVHRAANFSLGCIFWDEYEVRPMLLGVFEKNPVLPMFRHLGACRVSFAKRPTLYQQFSLSPPRTVCPGRVPGCQQPGTCADVACFNLHANGRAHRLHS